MYIKSLPITAEEKDDSAACHSSLSPILNHIFSWCQADSVFPTGLYVLYILVFLEQEQDLGRKEFEKVINRSVCSAKSTNVKWPQKMEEHLSSVHQVPKHKVSGVLQRIGQES